MLYHGLPDIRHKKLMRFIDYCSVFFLIVGTYTPYSLAVLRRRYGKSSADGSVGDRPPRFIRETLLFRRD